MNFGKQNLDSVKGINTEEMLKKQEYFKNLITEVKKAGININDINETIINEFRINTENTTKPFYKIAKKSNAKQKEKFIRDKVVPFWIKHVEEADKDQNVKDFREVLEKRDFHAYIMGIYIAIHSKNLSNELLNLLSSIIAEMSMRTASKIQKQQA